MNIKTNMRDEIINYLHPVFYNPHCQSIFFKDAKVGDQILVDVRGWGRISKREDGAKFQDELGDFIAQSINFGLVELMRQSTLEQMQKLTSDVKTTDEKDDYTLTIRLEQMDESAWWYRVEHNNLPYDDGDLNEGFGETKQQAIKRILWSIKKELL